MNDIWEIHSERIQDKKQIKQGLQTKYLKQSQIEYYERERQRQKKENSLIVRLKNVNKNFNLAQLKKVFLNTVVDMMNSHLQDEGKVIVNTHEFKLICDPNTPDSSKNSKIQQDSYKSISPQLYPLDQPIQKPFNNEDNFSNFYQTYINLFVNFFNIKVQQTPTVVKLDNIRSIIRPNNQFIIVDLLKALIECSRNEFRLLLKEFLNDETIRQNYITRKNMQMIKIDLDHIEETEQSETMTDLSGQKNMKRKVQTQPEVEIGDFNVQQLNAEMIRLNPAVKRSVLSTSSNCSNNHNHKRSMIISLLKRNSTQVLRSKTQDNTTTNSNDLIAINCGSLQQSRLMLISIKQVVYEKNYQFIKRMNLEKLESRANSLYGELVRLNGGNGEIIGKFYQYTLARRDKFNYDHKRESLQREIEQFKQKQFPNAKSSCEQLKAHIKQFISYRQKLQQLNNLSQTTSTLISPWLPLCLSHSNFLHSPLRLQIQQINQSTGEIVSYHWRKYRKPFSISDFLKQKIKAQYEKTIRNKLIINQKNVQVVGEIFKKKKFKRAVFVDNRKEINELLQKNNFVSIKKDIVFPLIRGTQESCMKNSSNINTIINQNTTHQQQYPIYKNKDLLRSDYIQKKIQNLSTKQSFNNSGNKPKQLLKDQESMKRTHVRQHSQRKHHSQSQKMIERLTVYDQRQAGDMLLCRLSTKLHPTPVSLTNRDSTTNNIQKYQRKSLISIPKYIVIKPQQHPNQQKISGSIQKLPVINLMV